MNQELRRSFALIAIASTLAMTACGKSYSSAPSRVAAVVNGEEITVQQIGRPNAPATGDLPATPPSSAALEALDNLIDQELLAQKAQETRLDRNPRVLLEIEAAKHRILAQAYVDRSMRSATVSPEEIGKYYREHPALFEQRRIYQVNELIAVLDGDHLQALQSQLAGSITIDGIASWLRSQKLPVQQAVSIKAAEQIPPDLLPRIAPMKNGQIAVFEAPGTVSIVQLLQSQDAPLSLREAKPAIEQRLLNQKRQAFARSKARQLREQARIEYLGPFADAKSTTPPAPAANGPSAGNDEARLIKGL